MAPPRKKKAETSKRKEEATEADLSHVSETDEETREVKRKKKEKIQDESDAFVEDDYVEPQRSLKMKLSEIQDANKKKTASGTKGKKKEASKQKMDNSSENKLEKMQIQINNILDILNNFSTSQISTGKASGRDLASDPTQSNQGDSGDELVSETRSSSTDSESSSESEDETPLKEHLANVTGGIGGYLQPSNVPLHAFVDKKLKKKIWDLKYIEFSKLLDKEDRPRQGKFTLEISDSKIHQVKPTDESAIDFHLWDRAFAIYFSVLANNPKGISPGLIDGLLQYRLTVSEIYRNFGNWMKYDVKFRKYVQNSGQAMFGCRIPELFYQCIDKPKKSPLNNRIKSKGNFQRPCHKFNASGCDNKNCQYDHICKKCKSSSHPMSKCFSVTTKRNSNPN